MATMNIESDMSEKIIIEDELPPMEEAGIIEDPEDKGPPTMDELVIQTGPKMGKKADGDYVFGKDEVRKEINAEVITGDKAYVGAGHGAVLLEEKISKMGPQEKHDYYNKGYTGQKKDDFGDENARNYDVDREADMMGRKLAADWKHNVTEAPEIGPRKALKEKAGKKKTKIVESMGSERFPERLALPEGRFS